MHASCESFKAFNPSGKPGVWEGLYEKQTAGARGHHHIMGDPVSLPSIAGFLIGLATTLS